MPSESPPACKHVAVATYIHLRAVCPAADYECHDSPRAFISAYEFTCSSDAGTGAVMLYGRRRDGLSPVAPPSGGGSSIGSSSSSVRLMAPSLAAR